MPEVIQLHVPLYSFCEKINVEPSKTGTPGVYLFSEKDKVLTFMQGAINAKNLKLVAYTDWDAVREMLKDAIASGCQWVVFNPTRGSPKRIDYIDEFLRVVETFWAAEQRALKQI